VVGSGVGLGHIGVQFARTKGMRVVGTDARDEGLVLTRKSGAEVALDARMGNERVIEEVRGVKGTVLCSSGESRDMMKFVAEHGISVKTNPFYKI